MFAQNMQQSRGFGAFKFPKGGIDGGDTSEQAGAQGAAAADSGAANQQFNEDNGDEDLYS
ncbi:hypothetical protein FBU59_001720 [Linderina macrospora]|uniref:Uncharacterized protein n=1 Tax=Linderina macrospora TaxID=4868 RepID=A0ACC1JDI3_9FUNG|nr:hypothetical protein FBU59_001720 [Linderina macrospora]